MSSAKNQSDQTNPSASNDPLDELLERSRSAPSDPWLAHRVLQRIREEKRPSAPVRLWALWWDHRMVRAGALAAVLLALVFAVTHLPDDSTTQAPSAFFSNSGESIGLMAEWNDEAIFEDLDILLADYQMEAWLAFDSSSFN